VDLHPEEPDLGPWRAVDEPELLTLVGSPSLVLVDGRSGGGKTTFATGVAALLGASVVHTDDVAWHLSMFDWASELTSGVLDPWSRDEDVSYRPPGWIARERPGVIEAAGGRPLVVEGVGSGRASLAERADLVVWVQSDRIEARTRGIVRDASYGTRTPAEAEEFWDHWLTGEDPFLAADRPWDRADLVVLGTPPDAGTWVGQGR
jgi:hypothetical protein